MTDKQYTIVFKRPDNSYEFAQAHYATAAEAKKLIEATPRDTYVSATILVRTPPKWEEYKE